MCLWEGGFIASGLPLQVQKISRTPRECKRIACAGALTAIIPCLLFLGYVSTDVVNDLAYFTTPT